ncbi:FG-GAP-like repeat-containing protein [Streptomyces sp. I6]|uniref:FG-GAP-like repeat-containing protein n=1 Tax=Streptomyces sp. I6 TaxID=2483113 RepID=UPI00288054D6|nr:FG-GAP-like repeat-containing protein [Streptomyces sp. I6]
MRCRPVAFTAVCTAVVCLTGLTAAVPPSAPVSPLPSPVRSQDAPGRASPAPGAGGIHSVPVPGSDPRRRALPARTTEPFSLVGITWDDPDAELTGTAEVRTRDSRTGAWSPWHTLEVDVRTSEAGPGTASAGLRAGSLPLWTGPSDGVQLRAVGTALPRGLRVELVDPQVGVSAPTSARAEAPAGAPPMTMRAGWGADESKVGGPPTYNSTTKALFVHHTAGSNTYQCADSPAIVRAVFTYHVEGQGWNDIGYHFLVDKCGRIFEGRAGGIDRPVQGAHTYGFNVDTSSVSVIGDYSTAAATPAIRDAVARLAAWKLGLYGLAVDGTSTLTASTDNGKFRRGQRVVLPRLPGHRDAYRTECPGARLYADLPAIRRSAAALGDGPGTGEPEPSGAPWPLDPGAEAAAAVPDGAEEQDSAGGDFDGDGDRDLAVAFRTPEGAVALVVLSGPERGRGTASPTVLMGAGGSALASGDMNGDGFDDLAVSTGRGIVTYHGSPTGLSTAGAPALAVGADATALTVLDLDGDGYGDLLAGPEVIASGGPLGLTVPGNGAAAPAG